MPSVPTTTTATATESSPTTNSLQKILIQKTKIPLQPPLNPEQANKWTKNLWPVTYNPAAPRSTIAPPPQVLNKAKDSIQPWAGRYLGLAEQVAKDAEKSGIGRCVGAVVVDPSIRNTSVTTDYDGNWMDAVVAVAGDARYSRREGDEDRNVGISSNPNPNPATRIYNSDLEGGPELHALMRVVDMVARRRREEKDDINALTASTMLTDLESHFLYASRRISEGSKTKSEEDKHTTKIGLSSSSGEKRKHTALEEEEQRGEEEEEENDSPRILPRSQGGYLCTDLDVYLTHEPCLCCSMGLILSRFRAVVFPRRRRMITGGLASEPESSIHSRTETTNNDDEDENENDENKKKDKNTHSTSNPYPHIPVKQNENKNNKINRIYYGLHWRKELNWRALAFEFVEDDGYYYSTSTIDTNANANDEKLKEKDDITIRNQKDYQAEIVNNVDFHA